MRIMAHVFRGNLAAPVVREAGALSSRPAGVSTWAERERDPGSW